jgi:hypothetical protein
VGTSKGGWSGLDDFWTISERWRAKMVSLPENNRIINLRRPEIMTLNRTHPFVALFILLVLALIGSGAQAQKALPQFGAETAPAAPTAVSPNTTDTLVAGRMFLWTNVGAEKYVLKIKIVDNGKTHKLRLNAAAITCEINCRWVAEANDPLFELTRSGQTVKWKVIAKFSGGDVSRSANQTTYVDEVREPVLNAVGYGVELKPADNFNWLHYAVNTTYAMVVVDTDTNAVVYNGVVMAGSCDTTCTYSAGLIWGSLSAGQTYEWYVRAYGATGEMAKSQKRIFTTPN